MPAEPPIMSPDQVRADWLARLGRLVDQIETWARELDWSTRRLDKKITDRELGTYEAPGLMIQKEFTRILIDPISHDAPATEGVVDLYLMPGLDDIATLFHYNGGWQLHYLYTDAPDARPGREAGAKPLTRETFGHVIEEMVRHAR